MFFVLELAAAICVGREEKRKSNYLYGEKEPERSCPYNPGGSQEGSGRRQGCEGSLARYHALGAE